jgi:NAD-dependent SIR2 family protein deacetylase
VNTDPVTETKPIAAHTAVSYMNCPRCGLSIQVRRGRETIRHCPRCVARHRRLVELFASALPPETLYEQDRVPGSERPSDDLRRRDP